MRYRKGDSVLVKVGGKSYNGDIVRTWKFLWIKRYLVVYTLALEFELDYGEKVKAYLSETKWMSEKDILCQLLKRNNTSLSI